MPIHSCGQSVGAQRAKRYAETGLCELAPLRQGDSGTLEEERTEGSEGGAGRGARGEGRRADYQRARHQHPARGRAWRVSLATS